MLPQEFFLGLHCVELEILNILKAFLLNSIRLFNNGDLFIDNKN